MQRKIFFLAYFFICANCFAQQYHFVQYTPKDGLVNSRVRKSYQDSKGRMYFLTFGGLSVFDGARFRNFTTQNGLPADLVNDVLEVGDDSMLVATNRGGYLTALVRGKIELIKTEGNACPLINQFYRYNRDNIYLSSDAGLFVLQHRKIRELDVSLLTKSTGESPFLSNITGAGNHLVLSTSEMRSHQGLYLYDIKNNRICDSMLKLKPYLNGKDSSNRIWISMSDKLFMLDSTALNNGKLSLIPPVAGYRQTKNYSTTNLAFDKNCTWLVYRNKSYRNTEIRRIEESGAMFQMPLPGQATSADIKNILIDKENTIWLCNDGEGVFKIVNSPLRVLENPLGKSIQAHIEKAFYGNDITWYNTSSNQLFRKSQEGLQEYRCNINQSPVIFHQDGNKLLAYDPRYIYEGELSNSKFIFFRKIISFPDTDFFAQWQIVDGKGAILTSRKSTLCVWRNNKPIFQIRVDKNDRIEKMCLDKNNLLWVVKRHNGIDVYSIHPENILIYLQAVYHFAPGQLSGSPRSFVIDKTGLLWLGTRENGLFAYRQQGNRLNKLYKFDVSNGLTDNFVTSLACDSLDNIIAGTETGLDRIVHLTERSYRVENFSKSNSLFAYIDQVWADKHNQAFGLTKTGVHLQLYPPLQYIINKAPQLLLEEVRVNGKKASITGEEKFGYKQNNISFSIAAPSFIDEKQITFSYLLEGSGNDRWSDTAAANADINLTNLSSGKYRLKVKAFFPSTAYAPAETAYSFRITPPWWQTLWFRLGMLVLGAGVLFIAVRFYYRKKFEKQKGIIEKRQAIEKERTRIATDLHDDMGAGLSRIKFLSQSILNKKITDPVMQSELEKINNFSDEMSEKMGEIVWALNEKNDTTADLVAYTRSYAVEYLANHNIQCEAHTPLHMSGTFITGEMRSNIFLSVKECLHNIVKHAGATKVCFTIQLEDAMLIVIHDNGKGIDWKNQRPYSNGIQNITKRMKEINGQVSFINEQGTKVSLTIPLFL